MRRKGKRKIFLKSLLLGLCVLVVVGTTGVLLLVNSLSLSSSTSHFRSESGLLSKKTLTLFTTVLEADVM